MPEPEGYPALTGGPQNRPIIHHKPGFTQPCSRHRHAPFGTGALLAHRTRITPSHSVDERVFGRWHRCTGPYAALLRGTDAAGKSTQHDDAANLVLQACSGHHLDSFQCRISRYEFGSTVELLLNASSKISCR